MNKFRHPQQDSTQRSLLRRLDYIPPLPAALLGAGLLAFSGECPSRKLVAFEMPHIFHDR